MGKKYCVSKDTCIGCMLCVGTAPSNLELDGDGKAEVFKQPGTPDEEKAVAQACGDCPTGAISQE
jgi:ferredoxin